MDLTKQQAIEEHRKMWNWIAEHGWEVYKNNPNIMYLSDIKSCYISKIYGLENNIFPTNDCFCCEYAIEQSGGDLYNKCKRCPIDWGLRAATPCVTKRNNYESPYVKLSNLFSDDSKENVNEEEFKSLALQIANLPERKGEEK